MSQRFSGFVKKLSGIAGLLLTSAAGMLGLRFLWQRWMFPVRLREREVAYTDPTPHDFDEDDFRETPLQLLPDGIGLLYHRRYRVDLKNPAIEIDTLMQVMKADPGKFSPAELAVFKKTKGDPHEMRVGDEYFIHITGPWNGPVRVIDVRPLSFAFATMEEHLEAGEIHFSAMEHPTIPNAIRFQIESWARSRDEQVRFAYEVIPVAKAAQRGMWTFWCNCVAEYLGGEIIGKIDVLTEKTEYEEPIVGQQNPRWKEYEPHFTRFRAAKANFDLDRKEQYTEKMGWRVDKYQAELPPEPPGAPISGGAFELTKEVIRNYEFPPPDLVTGIFVPDEPLESRIMVVEAKFLFFKFFFGVRTSQVIDEVRDIPGRGKAQVWGFGYYTLEGHFEMGEITFTAVKFLDTGKVEFHINAYSKPDYINNPFYRIGFRLFGRGLQRRFGRESQTRMQQFVTERMKRPSQQDTPEAPQVEPVTVSKEATEKLEEIHEAEDQAQS